ncbi:MAG: hypothetical protein GWN99_12930 [Gemmatimonadetes bacterium]|uniref:Uncharacterized protein n=1 Tax=Candidatus Kutchimonas denitrificans TaxID=3056748 RepID=A0AAE5CBF1_9BACT|nr:hypothetical protein [Gemmatimonadota bacterium]NIR75782.1 hypothetical protein [Candidatus Kutchimonas denitrificans]NIS01950.1 hypothetical protein [Gemmatimonadota bacterium]NIT67754.1 hypothetical protein [Gemmatimonadota bacterium]NIU53741.1 hypothetical protein [Gemmatimonadota bacterium]
MTRNTPSTGFTLEIGERVYELSEAEFAGALYDLAVNLMFHKLVDRVTCILETSESELTGSGGSHFDPLCVSLYRHLKEDRCHGPAYEGMGGDPQSFRIHSIKDALAAVAFYLKAGDSVPHFIVGRPDRDLLVVQDRGRRTQVNVGDDRVVAQLERLITHGR